MLRCAAGGTVIGYLYNLVDGGTVSAYQSGFVYGPDGKAKPGMVCHYLAVARNVERGARVYDLLAGDSQFKRSFGEAAGELVWMVLRRARWATRIEDALRGVKLRLIRAANRSTEE